MNFYDNHPKMKYIYVGIDCHKYTHTAVVINCFNETLDSLTFTNEIQDFEKLVKMVKQYETEEIKAVYGLEDVKHLGHHLATFLINKGYQVRHVYSNLTFNERKKRPIISKTDLIDAECIAKVTLDNLDTLPLAKNEEIYWTLKQIVKMKSSIVQDNVKAKNKLHAQLMHHYPNYALFFTNFDCKTALALWENYPSPNTLKTLTIEELNDFIYKASKGKVRYSTVKRIYDLVHNSIYDNLEYQEERNILIVTLVRQIKNNEKQIEEMEKQTIKLYDKLNLRLHTINCLSKGTAAEIVAEIGNINRFSSKDKLARYAGIAPVSFSSGGHDKILRNEYGNRRLNGYIYYLAIRSTSPGKNKNTPLNAIFIEYYNRKLREGKTKKQALTCVMRRLINVIYKILKDNTDYYISQELEEKCKNTYLELAKQEQETQE